MGISWDCSIASSGNCLLLLFLQVVRVAADWTQRLKVVTVEVEDLVVT